jgi:hypothetical protein
MGNIFYTSLEKDHNEMVNFNGDQSTKAQTANLSKTRGTRAKLQSRGNAAPSNAHA